MSACLEVDSLAAGYGPTQVVWDASFSVAYGEIVCLIGSNGAGKTTILRTLSGLVRAWGGRVCLDGIDLTRADTKDIVAHGLLHVPEGRRLFAGLTVRDNLLIGARLRRDGRAAVRRDLGRIFELFPRLAERRDQDAGTLSGGEQQMCAIGRGLMGSPKLLMIDELSLGLAPTVVDDIVDRLRTVNADGLSLLIVEQDVATALELAHRAYVVDQGRTVASGTAAEIGDDPMVRSAYLGF